jgi:hypothetical protein
MMLVAKMYNIGKYQDPTPCEIEMRMFSNGYENYVSTIGGFWRKLNTTNDWPNSAQGCDFVLTALEALKEHQNKNQ